MVTDFDAGLEGRPDVAAVTHEEVVAVFSRSRDRLVQALEVLIATVPEGRGCDCQATAPSVGPEGLGRIEALPARSRAGGRRP